MRDADTYTLITTPCPAEVVAGRMHRAAYPLLRTSWSEGGEVVDAQIVSATVPMPTQSPLAPPGAITAPTMAADGSRDRGGASC